MNEGIEIMYSYQLFTKVGNFKQVKGSNVYGRPEGDIWVYLHVTPCVICQITGVRKLPVSRVKSENTLDLFHCVHGCHCYLYQHQVSADL